MRRSCDRHLGNRELTDCEKGNEEEKLKEETVRTPMHSGRGEMFYEKEITERQELEKTNVETWKSELILQKLRKE